MKRIPVFFIAFAIFAACLASDFTDRRPPWDAALVVSYNTGAATDRSWTASNGTLTSGASIGNNTYVTLDGTDDYVDFGAVASHSSYPMSVSCWFNTQNQDQVSYASLMGKYVTASVNGWLIMMDTSERVGAFYYKDGSNYTGDFPNLMSASSYKDTTWHHMVFVVDTGGSTLYIDGASVDTHVWVGTPQVTTTAANTRMGAHTAAGFRWKGDLDEAQIYTRALSSSEVGAMYAEGRR